MHDEGREGGDCQREVERRPRVVLQRRDEREEAGEASGAARSVRRLRRRDGAVKFLKTAKGRTETRWSNLSARLGVRRQERRSVEDGEDGDGRLDDGRVVGAERRDDGVEQVGAVVLRSVLPHRRDG